MRKDDREIIDKLSAENKMLRHWLSLISHDFRGLFANMSMLLSLFDNNTISQETLLKMISEIKELSDRNNKIVESTIEWVKTQMNGFVPCENRVNLFELYNIVGKEHIDKLKTKEISFTFVGDKEIDVVTDRFLLLFILKHLVDNAIKYSFTNGMIQLVVDKDKTHVHIEIVDNGVGVDKDRIGSIFLFNKNIQTGTLGEKGAGLSLMIIHEFVELLNMKMEIDSAKDEGCVVKLSIPIA